MIESPETPSIEMSENAETPSSTPLHRNDTISPLIVLVFVAFWLLQSTYFGTILHLFSKKSTVTKVSASASASGVPSAVAKGIIRTDLEAKTTYLTSGQAMPVAGPLQQKLASQMTKARQKALADVTKLFAQYPDQPSLATRVILLRAETGDPNPLAAVYLSNRKVSHLPLDSYNVYEKLPAVQRAPYERARMLWQQLLGSNYIPSNGAPAIAAEIRAVPNLRWWIGPALHQLYIKDGDTRSAQLALASAAKEAEISVGVTTVIELVAIIVGLLGVGALILLLGSKVLNKRVPLSLLNPSPALIRDEDRRLGAGDLINVFALYLVLLLIVSLVAPTLLKGPIHSAQNAGSAATTSFVIATEAVLTLLCGTVAVIALNLLARRRGASLAREIGLNIGPRPVFYTLVFGLVGWGIALPVVIGVAMLSGKIFHNAPSPSNPAIPLLMTAPAGWASVVLYILVAVLAPFFEETLFRGMFYNAARLRVGAPGGILLTGAAFGLAHPVGIAEQIPLMCLGAIFAWMAETRKSLLPSMFAHCLQNSFVYATLLFSLLTVSPK